MLNTTPLPSGAAHIITEEPPVFPYAPKVDKTLPIPPTDRRNGEVVYNCKKDGDLGSRLSNMGLRYSVFKTAPREGEEVAPFREPDSEDDTTLMFESRFESGNLQRAEKVAAFEYNLTLRRDIRTVRHTQWFYFRASNTRAGQVYRFNIVNLLKSDSLYNHGMQPVVYSVHEADEKQVGWHRAGSDIRYYKNGISSSSGRRRLHHHTLTFAYEALHDGDTVYFAHCYPYTYSDLEEYLLEVKKRPGIESICRSRTLCKTLAGNACHLLTITNYKGADRQAMAARKGVVITARVHPGESNASWMMKGVLDYILSDSPDAKVRGLRLRWDHRHLSLDCHPSCSLLITSPPDTTVGNAEWRFWRCSRTGSGVDPS